MDDAHELLKPAEVAHRLRVSVQTVYRWADEGVLPSVRVGGIVRIPATALAKINEQTEAAS